MSPVMLTPRKRLGQNFLQDPNTARKIVAALVAEANDPVVEIGPGTGALTGWLLERYAHLTALEVDERAVALLRTTFPTLDVRQMDVLLTDWAALSAEKGETLHVIGNLPYYITSPILFALLDARRHLHEAVVMVQQEVAERIVATPRTKDYGILSVVFQLYTRPQLLFKVSRNVFFPRPDVTSAVLRLDFTAEVPDVEEAHLRQVVRAAFNQRRKTLTNSLSAWTREQEIVLPDHWKNRRAEELPPGEFVQLARYLRPAR